MCIFVWQFSNRAYNFILILYYLLYYINLYISLKGSFDFFIDQAHSQIEHFKKKEEERSFSEDSN